MTVSMWSSGGKYHPLQEPAVGMYTLVMSYSVLSIVMLMVSSSRWGSFFDVVDSGLRVKLTELWIKNSKPSPGPRRRSCRTRV